MTSGAIPDDQVAQPNVSCNVVSRVLRFELVEKEHYENNQY